MEVAEEDGRSAREPCQPLPGNLPLPFAGGPGPGVVTPSGNEAVADPAHTVDVAGLPGVLLESLA